MPLLNHIRGVLRLGPGHQGSNLSRSSGSASTTLQKHHYQTSFVEEIRKKTPQGLQKNKSIFNPESLWISSWLCLVMTGTVKRGEESMFLFVWKTATVYLFGKQNFGEIGFSICRCRILSFLPLDNSLRGMPCQFFFECMFWCFHFPQTLLCCVIFISVLLKLWLLHLKMHLPTHTQGYFALSWSYRIWLIIQSNLVNKSACQI